MPDKEELKKDKVLLEEESKNFHKNAISHAIFERGFKTCNNCTYTCEGRIENSYCLQEKIFYNAIVKALENDIKKVQLESNFAVEVLIGEIAMTLIKLSRLHLYELSDNLFVREHVNFETRLNPVYEYDMTLQNHLNKLMSKLGIMPLQLLGRRTTKIAESLEMELTKLQTETLETKSTGANLRLKNKKVLEKPIEN